MTKSDSGLFSHNEHALEKQYETCEKCDSELNIKNSKSGPFLGCSKYPTCDYSRPLNDHQQVSEIKLLDNPPCPDCNSQLAVKNGRYGMFIGCTNYPDCKYIAHMDEQEDTGIPCPSCKASQLTQRSNRYGKTFYACNGYPKCKYAVNFKPIQAACPLCNWQILIEKNTAKGLTHQCPQKNCKYKSEPI
jgi:putative DNA topoisomerase